MTLWMLYSTILNLATQQSHLIVYATWSKLTQHMALANRGVKLYGEQQPRSVLHNETGLTLLYTVKPPQNSEIFSFV